MLIHIAYLFLGAYIGMTVLGIFFLIRIREYERVIRYLQSKIN